MPQTENGDPPPIEAAALQASPPLILTWPAFLIAAVLLTAASGLVSDSPNPTSIGAVALFGGVSFAIRLAAFLVPLGAISSS
jgi:hypothetical protein